MASSFWFDELCSELLTIEPPQRASGFLGFFPQVLQSFVCGSILCGSFCFLALPGVAFALAAFWTRNEDIRARNSSGDSVEGAGAEGTARLFCFSDMGLMQARQDIARQVYM